MRKYVLFIVTPLGTRDSSWYSDACLDASIGLLNPKGHFKLPIRGLLRWTLWDLKMECCVTTDSFTNWFISYFMTASHDNATLDATQNMNLNTGTAWRLFFESKLFKTHFWEDSSDVSAFQCSYIHRSYRGHHREIRLIVSYWLACDCCCFDVSLLLFHPYCNVIKLFAIKS
jgi:hypothetical protein